MEVVAARSKSYSGVAVINLLIYLACVPMFLVTVLPILGAIGQWAIVYSDDPRMLVEEYRDAARVTAMTSTFLGVSMLLVCFLILVVALAMNLAYLSEANRMESIANRTLPGVVYLRCMFWGFGVPPALAFAFIFIAYVVQAISS